MTRDEALKILLNSPGGRVKYRGSKFGDGLRSRLCREGLIRMEGVTNPLLPFADGYMVLTEMGILVAKKVAS